jgi:hypothetical protein
MEAIKRLGIWMDHSKANLIEYNTISEPLVIELNYSHQNKMADLHHSESGMHHKEKQIQEVYFKKIGVEILKYNQVVLFGPTNAKDELHNYLSKTVQFKDVRFNVLDADKMTDNQQKAYVDSHFNSSLGK